MKKMTLERQIEDWERLNLLLDKIVSHRTYIESDLKIYEYFRMDYNLTYKSKFNPMEKPKKC